MSRETATLTIFEAVAFGRLAHGETRVDAALADRWRLRRGGKLVFAEALRIENAGATLDRVAVGAGARALATLVRIGPDAAAKLDPLRERLAALEAGRAASRPGRASSTACWSRGCASPSPQRLRARACRRLAALWRGRTRRGSGIERCGGARRARAWRWRRDLPPPTSN